jgi:hypothetical protein
MKNTLIKTDPAAQATMEKPERIVSLAMRNHRF